MNLLLSFAEHWKEKFAGTISPDSTLLLAISGGVDSVVLAHLLHRAGFPLQLAHMNFQLRGEESNRDEEFVRAFARKLAVPIHVEIVNAADTAAVKKISIQEAARQLRYDWFKKIKESIESDQKKENKNKGCWILTAHHADDNNETLLLHLFRGTGLEGLAGIQPMRKEEALIRPLLPFYKEELMKYAAEHELNYVEDSSNAEHHYTRNKLRLQLMPVLEDLFPEVNQQLTANIERFREGLEIYRQAIATKIDKISTMVQGEQHIPVAVWKGLQPLNTYTWEIIRSYGFQASQIYEVIQLLDAETGKYIRSATHRILRNRSQMVIAPIHRLTQSLMLIEENDTQLNFAQGELLVEEKTCTRIPTTVPVEEIYIPVKLVKFPLLLRPWKQGDYFYPLGLNKKKKISRLLIDLKFSATEKEKVWVLESDKKIIWVVGIRLDHRFRIEKENESVLHFIYRK